MFSLKKLYLENFKGVYRPTVLSLDEAQLTILNGPNGFGKTTVFDVIELCLRGHLERTKTYNYVTKKNADHTKPFYQNRQNEDVILKLWLADDGQDHIIVKRLDRANLGSINGSRRFRPDAWELLETYYTTDTTIFDQPFQAQVYQKIEQPFIDQLFFGLQQVTMTNLYPLFNYLQQEDNIYFLKKDEETKAEQLNFLFQTQKQAHELEQMTTFQKNLKSIKDLLAARIKEIGRVEEAVSGLQYRQLYPNLDSRFDQEEPFQEVRTEDLNAIYERDRIEVQNLINFTRMFDFAEYQKDKLRTQLNFGLSNNWLFRSIVLFNFLDEESFNSLRQRVENNSRLNKLAADLNDFKVDFDSLPGLGFSDEFVGEFRDMMRRRQLLQSQIGEIGRIVRELNQARETTLSRYQELNVMEPQPENCPLCDSDLGGLDNLVAAINDKTQSLTKYNQAQLNEYNILENQIKTEFIRQVVVYVESSVTNSENAIDPEFYSEVRERRGNLAATVRFKEILITNQIQIEDLILRQHTTIARVDENVAALRERIAETINSLQVDESRLADPNVFRRYYNEVPENVVSLGLLEDKLNYITSRYNSAKAFSVNILVRRLERLTRLESQVSTIKNKLSSAIKSYKRLMIEKIKVPFYIYSGKILQHYQQGYGIFIDVSDTTNRVRFLTDEATDHDIIHQLSSGQLAVVSIAFCLALNKVYETPSHFKFLAIDDPIQTLDDLNIHSFIELIRHEFSSYQMLISTHEENVSNYLDYRFNKFSLSCREVNVQSLFYQNQIG